MQRKIFRVEQMFGNGRASAHPPRNHEKAEPGVTGDLAALRETIARNRRELQSLQRDGAEPRMARAAFELGAAVDGMEKATHKILRSTEAIDESAKTLAATTKSAYERGLAQDIQDNTMRIYEACNFQDLAGQRIGKALAALHAVEAHVQRMVALMDNPGETAPPTVRVTRGAPAKLMNGPKLEGDSGHASQQDIDEMFG